MAVDRENSGETGIGIRAGFGELDQILRGELTQVASLKRGGVAVSPGRLSLVIVLLAMAYGICMGTFAMFRMKQPHGWQMIASMVKVPLLFYLTLLVTLPSLYVFNALVGSRLTLTTVIRLLLASLGVMVAVLASLGPIVAFFSVSTTSYPFMLLFNVVVFTVSGTLGLLFLLQTLHRLSILDSPEPTRGEIYEHHAGDERGLGESEGEPAGESLVESRDFAVRPSALDPLPHRAVGQHVQMVFNLWLIVFALVGAQMSWVLRPFIGSPDIPYTLFRPRESNFFQAVMHTVGSLFS